MATTYLQLSNICDSYVIQQTSPIELAKPEKGTKPCVHGLTHADINNAGEFGSLSSEETYRRIHKGKQVLSQYAQPINTFIPPFNATNASLSACLQENGITILSADVFRKVSRSTIQYYPETLGHLMAQKGIWNAAEQSILHCRSKEAICVVMFHAYDLPDSCAWKTLERLLDTCICSSDVELYTFSSLFNSGTYADWKRYKANQLESGLRKLLLPKGVLNTTLLCVSVHLLNALLYALIMLLSYLIYRYIRRRKSSYYGIVYGILGILVFFAAWFHWVGPLKLLALSILLALLPLCIAFIQTRRR